MALSGTQLTRLSVGGAGHAYAGFVAKAAAAVNIVEGLEYTMPVIRGHFTMPESRAHYDMPQNRLHYKYEDED